MSFIDDCSSDNSTELISDYIQSYKGDIEFRLLKQTKIKVRLLQGIEE